MKVRFVIVCKLSPKFSSLQLHEHQTLNVGTSFGPLLPGKEAGWAPGLVWKLRRITILAKN